MNAEERAIRKRLIELAVLDAKRVATESEDLVAPHKCNYYTEMIRVWQANKILCALPRRKMFRRGRIIKRSPYRYHKNILLAFAKKWESIGLNIYTLQVRQTKSISPNEQDRTEQGAQAADSTGNS